VTLLSWISLADFGGQNSGNDCWGYKSPSGREYAIIGLSNATAWVEISNPSNAQIVAILSGPSSLWRDIKVYDSYAYAVSEGGSGIQVFDMSNIDSGSVALANTVTTGGTTSTHNVAIDTDAGMLYRLGGSGEGLRIYSLANPVSPSYVGSWDTRYVHDAQVVTYTSGPYAGRQIAFCCSDGFQPALDILDVTNPNNVIELDYVTYSNSAYSHQGWLSVDRQYFYLGDELDENGTLPTTTHVIDVSNLTNANAIGTFTNGNTAIGHNIYTKDNLIYQANYTSGLRVFDTTNSATSPTEIAYFDTWASGDPASFNGLWSCYPYFDGGIVIGSDMEKGLFVWWVGDSPLTFIFPSGIPDTIDPAGESIPLLIAEANPGDLLVGSEKLFYDAGAGWLEVPLTSQGSGQYNVDFPAIPCGDLVHWYLSADSSSGMTWTEPAGAPGNVHSAVAAIGSSTSFEDDMETNLGWTSGASGDSATTGIWTRVNPIGTAAQPEDDHTPSGTRCWVTGQGSNGGSVGENDVDGGHTTLTTPLQDLSAASDPIISYWRWYSNDAGASPSNDIFEVDISNNGGSSWTSVEVIGPSGVDTSGGWNEHQFRVADFVAPTSQVLVRFVASDLGSGSIVEAAVDDFLVTDVICADCNGNGIPDDVDISMGISQDCNANNIPDECDIADGTSGDANGNGIPDECDCTISNYCLSLPNSSGNQAIMGSTGLADVNLNNFDLTMTGAAVNQFGLFFYGPNQATIFFGDGVLCVTGGVYRLNPPLLLDGSGAAQRSLDFSLPPANAGSGLIAAGSTWNFQCWYRDPTANGGGPAGYNLSDGLNVVFCP
jgi:choice-of-anchor B domain-containing protein